MDLTGRTAVVTGAASGMGNASAVLLAERGASVVLVDVNPSVEAFAVELDAAAHVGSVADSVFCMPFSLCLDFLCSTWKMP